MKPAPNFYLTSKEYWLGNARQIFCCKGSARRTKNI